MRYGNHKTAVWKHQHILYSGRIACGYGTLSAFYKALKANGIRLENISHVMATHYHPDHCGLIGEIQRHGIKLILLESQASSVHYADYIFERDGLQYIPIDEGTADLISFAKSREYLKTLGIAGEIIPTQSHSTDSISVILDNGDCLVGDLAPREYTDGYTDHEALQTDWEHVMGYDPKRILFAHMPEVRRAEKVGFTVSSE